MICDYDPAETIDLHDDAIVDVPLDFYRSLARPPLDGRQGDDDGPIDLGAILPDNDA